MLKSFCPSGVKEGVSPFCAAMGPAQAPVKSRLGAGPPGPLFSLSNSVLRYPPCALARDEKVSTAATTTIAPVKRFRTFAPSQHLEPGVEPPHGSQPRIRANDYSSLDSPRVGRSITSAACLGQTSGTSGRLQAVQHG